MIHFYERAERTLQCGDNIYHKLVRVYSFIHYIEENVKMFAALPRLGNEIAMLFQPIPSANGTDKFVEIRLSNANSKNVLVSMTNNIVIFFFFFVNSLSNHTGHHNEFMWSMNYRWGKISMILSITYFATSEIHHHG